MTLTCYVVDDEYHSIEVLKGYIEKTPGLELKGSSTNPVEALNEVACARPPDMVFLDIDMPELSGMEFAGLVQLYTKVIFTTSYREYAIEAFEKDAFDYLLKPVGYDRFLKSVNKVKKNLLEKTKITRPHDPWFYIKSDIKGKVIRVDIADIVYIEAAQNYIGIHTSATKHMAYLTMEEIQDKLPGEQFIRIHRAFIINNKRIRTVEHGQVTMDNNETIALGRFYKDNLLESVKELLIQSRRNTAG